MPMKTNTLLNSETQVRIQQLKPGVDCPLQGIVCASSRLETLPSAVLQRSKSSALHICQNKKLSLVAGDVDVAQDGTIDVLQRDASGAGASDVLEDESLEWFLGGDLTDIGKSRAGHADV